MKICQVTGDLSSEKSRENYPTDIFCDECVEEMESSENSGLISCLGDDKSFGDECSRCGKSREEEE